MFVYRDGDPRGKIHDDPFPMTLRSFLLWGGDLFLTDAWPIFRQIPLEDKRRFLIDMEKSQGVGVEESIQVILYKGYSNGEEATCLQAFRTQDIFFGMERSEETTWRDVLLSCADSKKPVIELARYAPHILEEVRRELDDLPVPLIIYGRDILNYEIRASQAYRLMDYYRVMFSIWKEGVLQGFPTDRFAVPDGVKGFYFKWDEKSAELISRLRLYEALLECRRDLFSYR